MSDTISKALQLQKDYVVSKRWLEQFSKVGFDKFQIAIFQPQTGFNAFKRSPFDRDSASLANSIPAAIVPEIVSIIEGSIKEIAIEALSRMGEKTAESLAAAKVDLENKIKEFDSQ